MSLIPLLTYSLLALLTIIISSGTAYPATLTFNDTSGIEKGFLIQHVKANGEFDFIKVPPMPSTGGVKFTLDAAPGDCFYIYAFNEAPLSQPTNRTCLQGALPNTASSPTGLAVALP